jgi:hypothetical protein
VRNLNARPSLTARVAEALGWSEVDVHGFSFATIRELVRVGHPDLYREISNVIANGEHIFDRSAEEQRRGRR